MNTGVSTPPCASSRRPRRAAPDVARTEKRIEKWAALPPLASAAREPARKSAEEKQQKRRQGKRRGRQGRDREWIRRRAADGARGGAEVERIAPNAVEVAAEIDAGDTADRIIRCDRDVNDARRTCNAVGN